MATSTNIIFFIHDDRATLIDFDSALQCSNAKVLEEAFRGLEKELSDMSGRGGRVAESNSEKYDCRTNSSCMQKLQSDMVHRETVVL